MKGQLMLIAALAIAVALIAALMAYMMTQATLVRVGYSAVKNELKNIREVTKQICPLSWTALKYASSTDNATLAQIITGNFARIVSKYSLVGIYTSINTTCTLNWGIGRAYSNITIVANVSGSYVEVKNIRMQSGLYVNLSYLSTKGGTYVLNLSVMVCKCGECFYTPITKYNTNLTQLESIGYVVTYKYLGNGTTEFIITKVGGPPGPKPTSPVAAVEVIYDGVKVIVRT